jgi:DNA-binding GntR family transcriptional regulator
MVKSVEQSVMEGGEQEARLSASDVIRDGVRRAILDGEFSPGHQLRQEGLAERFGTSRIPVREALRQLEVEGLVSLLPNRGATVSVLSLDEVLELMEIRIALECRALRLAIPNMVDSDFDNALEILRSYDLEPDPQHWGEINWTFHDALYAPCSRPKLLAMIEANYGHVGRYTRIWVSHAAGKERPQREHYAILDACRDENADRAVRLLEEHIVQTQKSIMASGRKRPAERG